MYSILLSCHILQLIQSHIEKLHLYFLYCMVNLNGIDVNKKLSLSKNNNEIIYITCFKLSHSTLRRSGQMNGEVYWKNTGNSFIFVCPLHAAITDGEFIKQNIWNWSVFPSGGNMCWETLLLKPKSISRCGFVSYKCILEWWNALIFTPCKHKTFSMQES